ncbi:MAG: MBL fold metallo-hydrolase [Myxococcales bacterium]|nr:MBL fold metallo-hydrolase [Myxococcales bacterium]
MEVRPFTVGMFQVNTYLLTDPTTGQCAIVDTGESNELVGRLKALDPAPDVRFILLTHAHIDHAGALTDLQAEWDVPTYCPRLEKPLFDTLPYQGTMFGMPHLNRAAGRIDHWIDDGFALQLGETTLRFLSAPGHTPGQGCWFDDEHILVGDVLFAGSIGRTDFPMSDPRTMTESLRKLLQLPGHLKVWSGHGPMTTLADELATNPFLGYLREERGIASRGASANARARQAEPVDGAQ